MTVYRLDEADLVAIVQIALGNPIRTVLQQESLVHICQGLDNPMVSWSTDAGATWEGTRCGCGRPIPVMSQACATCHRERVR